MVREPQGAHRTLCSCAPGEREIKFKFSWLSVRVFSFFLSLFFIPEIIAAVSHPRSFSVPGLLQPRYFRLLRIHTFLRKNGNFFVFSLQQATWKASSSVIDDGYSKQMSEKKTNCVSPQLASQQSCTEEAKPRELRPIWKYLQHKFCSHIPGWLQTSRAGLHN